ncbi:MAG: gamma-glutamyltransferase [Rhodothermales bacterium]
MTLKRIHGGADRLVGRAFASRSPVLARNGMAATSHPIASFLAVETLKRGGSAVDAAIAANAALGVMEPVNCGIGGDLFALLWDPDEEALVGLNASGRSPRRVSRSVLRSRLASAGTDRIPLYGPLSVSVPGAVDGWFELHDRYGRLPMADLLAPAIAYARQGVPVPQTIAHHWSEAYATYSNHRDSIGEFDNFQATFLVDGRPPGEGEVFANPDLARTYERIAAGGRDAFYRGEVAETVDAYMRRVGGWLRKEDLADHAGEWVAPISTTYRGVDVYELPPNGQGAAVLQMLNILEGFDVAEMGHHSADYLHVHAEAKKLAFEDRARYYADPDYIDAPVDELISKNYARRLRDRVRMDDVLREIHHAPRPLDRGDTVYLTTADADGMMVSFIQSNFHAMGSGLVPDGLGFGLQNRGALFTLEEGHPNVYAPGKRPFHTIIPAFAMRNGRPWMSFGVMGGPMQPQGQVQVLCNMIDFGMNVQEAGDAARYRHDGSSSPTGDRMTDGGVLRVESGVAADVVEALRARGHRVEVTRGGYGGYQAICRQGETIAYHGASEMRKDGQAIGY